MIPLLINLIIVVVVLAVLWMILSRIPIPADIKWLADVVFLIIAAICVLSILGGWWSFPAVHPIR